MVSQYKGYLLQLYNETTRVLNLKEFAKNQKDELVQQMLENLKLYQLPSYVKKTQQRITNEEEVGENCYSIINKCIAGNNYELLYTVCNSDEYKPYIQRILNGTLFHQACKNGNLNVIKICIESGADVFVKNEDGKYIKDYTDLNENVKKYITDYCNFTAFDEAKKIIENKKDYNRLCDLVIDYKDSIFQKGLQTQFNLL